MGTQHTKRGGKGLYSLKDTVQVVIATAIALVVAVGLVAIMTGP